MMTLPTREEILRRTGNESRRMMLLPYRQRLLATARACVEFVAQYGSEAGRLRQLPENKEGHANGTESVVADAVQRLVSPRLLVERNLYAATAKILGIPAFIVRGALYKEQETELDLTVAALEERVRPCVDLGEFFEHPLGSRGQFKAVGRALNTSRKHVVRARKRSHVRSSEDPAEQHKLAKAAYDPDGKSKLAPYTEGSRPRNPERELITTEAEERIEKLLSKLRPKERRLAERILELLETEPHINKAALHDESKSWSKNGRGIALPNIEKMCRRILEIRLDIADAFDLPPIEEAPISAPDSGSITIQPTESANFEDFTLGDGFAGDLADTSRADLRELADGCFVSTPTDSERPGASRMDQVLYDSPYIKKDFGGPKPSEFKLMQGAGRAVLFPELPAGAPVPDYQARAWEFGQRPDELAGLGLAAITDPASSPYLNRSRLQARGYRPRYIGPRQRTARDTAGSQCVSTTKAEIEARERRSGKMIARVELQRAREARIAAERWARFVKAGAAVGLSEEELARLRDGGADLSALLARLGGAA